MARRRDPSRASRGPIQRSAWKGYSRKSLCSILHRETRARLITLLGLVIHTEADYDILEGRIKMRWREYLRYLTPRYFVHAVK